MPSGRTDEEFKKQGVRFPLQDPTKGGRNPSIRKQLKELLASDGVIIIPKDQIVSVNEDGSVAMKVPTEYQLALKLKSIAMGKNTHTNTLKAIQIIMEQVDGKPTQAIEQTNYNENNNIDYSKLSDKELSKLREITEKAQK